LRVEGGIFCLFICLFVFTVILILILSFCLAVETSLFKLIFDHRIVFVSDIKKKTIFSYPPSLNKLSSITKKQNIK